MNNNVNDLIKNIHGKWVNETDFTDKSFEEIKMKSQGDTNFEKLMMKSISSPKEESKR